MTHRVLLVDVELAERLQPELLLLEVAAREGRYEEDGRRDMTAT